MSSQYKISYRNFAGCYEEPMVSFKYTGITIVAIIVEFTCIHAYRVALSQCIYWQLHPREQIWITDTPDYRQTRSQRDPIGTAKGRFLLSMEEYRIFLEEWGEIGF
jgi:hypothetical protein